jgi:hypothetical protein
MSEVEREREHSRKIESMIEERKGKREREGERKREREQAGDDTWYLKIRRYYIAACVPTCKTKVQEHFL